MSPLRSVGARLSLALALVVALALGVVWAIVVPPLERDLTQAKVNQLANQGAIFIAQKLPDFELNEQFRFEYDVFAEDAAFATNARVVVYREQLRRPRSFLSVWALSPATLDATEFDQDLIADRASTTRIRAEGVVTRGGQRFAEVAFPIRGEPIVVLFSATLEDTLSNVQEVKRRLLIAGVVALGLALLLGYSGASIFARRIGRLERAADRIAGGELDEPVAVEGRDEVGQLSEAFERMRRRLAQLDHARREFIANASHELRTPIFSLGGFLELLASEELDEETRREFLGTMQEQVARLERLATDLLDLTRLDAGQLRLDVERLDLQRLAEALAEEFAGVALATDHVLNARANGAAPQALADETRTLQIGRALVENAIRHTPPGTVVLVGTERVDGRAVLVVEDDGPGIAPEHVGQVFERFYRVEGAKASGSGLGLAIARQLAAAMGGTVEVESRPGRTVFRLALPAAGRVREPVAS
jgi:signal transduction histidine kinase